MTVQYIRIPDTAVLRTCFKKIRKFLLDLNKKKLQIWNQILIPVPGTGTVLIMVMKKIITDQTLLKRKSIFLLLQNFRLERVN
jgi:hypothetical protein